MEKRLHRLLTAALIVAATASAASAQAFPVTIQHYFGETTIASEPKRIVTWDWASEDALIALGVVPVGMPFFSYGGDADGYHPWTRKALDEMGATMPEIIKVGDGIAAEQIAALDPDLILAAYSGIDDEEYKRLSQIAPVVAYPDGPWATSWQDVVLIVGAAIGKPGEAQQMVDDTEAFIRDTFAAHPQIGDVSFAVISGEDTNVTIFTEHDARLKFLTSAGMTLAPSVVELTPKDSDSFYFDLSQELFQDFRSDIYITWFVTEDETRKFLGQPLIARSPQVAAGAVASLNSPEEISPVSPPTPLSLRWGLPLYVERIAAAATAAGR
jgi:iron complex transport system substrate-binding protein